MFGLAARRGEDWVPITSLPGASLSLWPQTTNDALDVVCTQCYAGESDLKNSCTECWVQKTKPGYLDLNRCTKALHWPWSDPNHWCTGSCVQKTKRGYLIKWTVSYCTVWHTPRKHISTYRPEWSDIVSKQWGSANVGWYMAQLPFDIADQTHRLIYRKPRWP